jgi:hypothetical protein
MSESRYFDVLHGGGERGVALFDCSLFALCLIRSSTQTCLIGNVHGPSLSAFHNRHEISVINEGVGDPEVK